MHTNIAHALFNVYISSNLSEIIKISKMPCPGGKQMDLREYVFRKRTNLVELSKKIPCSRNYLSEIALGKKIPSPIFAKVIEMVTNGEVTVEELLNPVKEESN